MGKCHGTLGSDGHLPAHHYIHSSACTSLHTFICLHTTTTYVHARLHVSPFVQQKNEERLKSQLKALEAEKSLLLNSSKSAEIESKKMESGKKNKGGHADFSSTLMLDQQVRELQEQVCSVLCSLLCSLVFL